MSDLAITTRVPQDTDTERLLLARLLASVAVKTTGTGLASAARTATTQTADITTNGYRGLVIFLNVTAASGTGGLTLRVRGKCPVSGAYLALGSVTSAVTAIGITGLQFGGGGAGTTATVAGGAFGGILPDTIRLEVAHGDASSYTYSVGYCLVP